MRSYRKRFKFKKKKSIFKSSNFWLSLVFFAFSCLVVYFLFFSRFFNIEKVFVVGQERLQKEEIENLVKNNLKRKILFFETKNIFLANLSDIEKKILSNFPQIFELKIKRKLPNSLIVELKERKEIASFCHGECFLLDKEGVVFEKNQENLNLPKIENEDFEGEIKLGEKILEKEILEKILQAKNKIEELEIEIEKILVSKENFYFFTKDGWKIILNPKEDIDWQVKKLEVALKEAIPKEKRGLLEYIDLRFGNFAFPKYKK